MESKYLLNQFNNLHGKKVYRNDVINLLEKVREHNAGDLKDVEQRLTRMITHIKPGQRLKIKLVKKAKLGKVKSLPASKKRSLPEAKKTLSAPPVLPVAQVKNKVSKLSGVVSGEDISKMNFSQIKLSGRFKDDFIKIYSDTLIMSWGKPGHGKTVHALEFAQYLAEQGYPVLFVANEELNRSTLTEKTRKFNIHHKNLSFVRKLDDLKISNKTIDDFEMVFFDSIQSLKMNLDTFEKFVEDHPGKMYFIIVQTTKDGHFKGGQEWLHAVDIGGEIINRRMVLYKNRLDSEFDKKSDKLIFEQKVKDAKKRLSVKDEVKKLTAPKPPAETKTVIYL